jgi:hypothetical protein
MPAAVPGSLQQVGPAAGLSKAPGFLSTTGRTKYTGSDSH